MGNLKNRKPTIRDVAKRAGVSIATVSYVLNDPSRISEETRHRVLDIVNELQYRPSVMAQGMRSLRTRTLGLIIRSHRRQLSDPFLRILIMGLAEQASIAGYYLLIVATKDGAVEMETYDDLIKSSRVDGMVLIDTRINDARQVHLVETDFPFVSFGRSTIEHGLPWVDVDGHAGCRTATNYLIQRGHTRIAFIGLPKRLMCETHRRAGYEVALSEHGLAVDPDLIMESQITEEGGQETMCRLLAVPQPPTAVLACSDLMAIGAINAVKERGLRVPEDVAIIGFDDLPIARHIRPALTTMRQPIYEVGQLLVEALVGVLNDEPLEEAHILLQPTLILRESA